MDSILRLELVGLAEQDHACRRRWQAAVGDAVAAAAVAAVDRRNAARLRRIIDLYGWPDVALVGEDGSDAAWLLAQHADTDPDLQRHCLALLTAAVNEGQAKARHLAYLTDRVAVGERRPQSYGTQATTVDGATMPYPIRDADRVDERRAVTGLGPLADYLDTFRS